MLHPGTRKLPTFKLIRTSKPVKGPGDLHLFEYNELCSPSSVVAKSPDADGDHNFTHSSRSSIQSPTDQDGAGGLSSSLNINRRDYSTRGTRINLSQEWFCTSTSGGSSPMLTTKPLLTAFRVSLVLVFGAPVDLRGSVIFGRVAGRFIFEAECEKSTSASHSVVVFLLVTASFDRHG